MRIHVNCPADDGKHRIRLWLWLPTCLATGAFTAWIVSKSLSFIPDQAVKRHITYENIRVLQRTLRQCRRKLRGQPLIEAHGSGNEHVTIRL